MPSFCPHTVRGKAESRSSIALRCKIDGIAFYRMQEELVSMGVMRPSADAALAARSAIRAAKSARRLKDAQQKREFRRFTTPNGLQVPLWAGMNWIVILTSDKFKFTKDYA